MNEVRIATRRSALAVAQAHRVAALVTQRCDGVSVSLVEVDTAGDRDRISAITTLTELGAFVRSVQYAVLDDRADLAVHSLKDLPVAGPEGLVPPVYPERDSPLDVLVGAGLDRLPVGATVGTGSPRRAAQLTALRPDLRPAPIRGNVETRLAKVAQGEFDAAVLAEAGLERLGESHAISRRFRPDEMTPAPGQGALAVEARRGSRGAEVAAVLDDPELRTLITAERELMKRTGAGCRSALGALATRENGQIRMDLFVSDEKGSRRAVVHGAAAGEVVSLGRKELGL
jgi:hydroxymethylbilane synthase